MKSENKKDIYKANNYTFKPCLFLDRDGVIIEDCHYIKDPEKVKLCPGIIQLIEIANKLEWYVVVITNQSGIHRGLISWDQYRTINSKMIKLLGKNALISAIYANGSNPKSGINSWRKPSPLMLLDAAETLNINLKESIIIGDRLSDLVAGKQAGLRKLCHVFTGHGESELQNIIQEFKISSSIQNPVSITKVNEFKIAFMQNLTYFPMEFF